MMIVIVCNSFCFKIKLQDKKLNTTVLVVVLASKASKVGVVCSLNGKCQLLIWMDIVVTCSSG